MQFDGGKRWCEENESEGTCISGALGQGWGTAEMATLFATSPISPFSTVDTSLTSTARDYQTSISADLLPNGTGNEYLIL
ncbi:MAG: hypothetical protein L6R41_006216 [Letrouitia leprolyta]|nr:MAG: hypothetical protein L6R41_006216 [Letrouitia leprolyta]